MTLITDKISKNKLELLALLPSLNVHCSEDAEAERRDIKYPK